MRKPRDSNDMPEGQKGFVPPQTAPSDPEIADVQQADVGDDPGAHPGADREPGTAVVPVDEPRTAVVPIEPGTAVVPIGDEPGTAVVPVVGGEAGTPLVPRRTLRRKREPRKFVAVRFKVSLLTALDDYVAGLQDADDTMNRTKVIEMALRSFLKRKQAL